MEKNRQLVEIPASWLESLIALSLFTQRLQQPICICEFKPILFMSAQMEVSPWLLPQQWHRCSSINDNLERAIKQRVFFQSWNNWPSKKCSFNLVSLAASAYTGESLSTCVWYCFFPLRIFLVIHNQKLGKPRSLKSSAAPSCRATRLFRGEDEDVGCWGILIMSSLSKWYE